MCRRSCSDKVEWFRLSNGMADRLIVRSWVKLSRKYVYRYRYRVFFFLFFVIRTEVDKNLALFACRLLQEREEERAIPPAEEQDFQYWDDDARAREKRREREREKVLETETSWRGRRVACSRTFGLRPKRDVEWTWRENRIGACFLLSYDRHGYNSWQYPCTGCVETSLCWEITLKITPEFIDSFTSANKLILLQISFTHSAICTFFV